MQQLANTVRYQTVALIKNGESKMLALVDDSGVARPQYVQGPLMRSLIDDFKSKHIHPTNPSPNIAMRASHPAVFVMHGKKAASRLGPTRTI